MSGGLAALAAVPVLAAALLAAAGVMRLREIRQARREAARRALARHPAQQARRWRVPDNRGCKPLTDEELTAYTEIMTRLTDGRGNQARNSADEGAELWRRKSNGLAVMTGCPARLGIPARDATGFRRAATTATP